MRVLILCSPGLFMFFGVIALLVLLRNRPAEQRGQFDFRYFGIVTGAVGLAILVWMGIVLPLDLVRPAFPLIIGGVGVVLLLQGLLMWRLRRR